MSPSEQCEAQLRAEVLSARALLDATCARRNKVRRMSVERGITSDGTVTLKEAQQLYEDARLQFSRALKRFSDLVMCR